MKKILVILYSVVVAVMAAATFIEYADGTRIYSQWWFSLLWGMLAAVSIAWFVKQRVRRLSAVLLHLSFVIILLGALLTHLLSTQGIVHLRENDPTNQYMDKQGYLHLLPFTLTLDSFNIVYHAGTTAAADYQSHLTLTQEGQTRHAIVSMNNVYSLSGVRLYQNSYDSDLHGTVLTMNSDPWGIPVTYTGYALLFIALVWVLIDPKGQYRQLLRSKRFMVVALLIAAQWLPLAHQFSIEQAKAQTVLPQPTAQKFGQLLMLYNDRICPVETYALDFTKKLYGKTHYGDYSAVQVLTGFIFYGDEWSREPIVRIKSGDLKDARQLADYCTVEQFFAPGVGYVLGPIVQEYYQNGKHDGFHKQAAKIDDQLMMVMDLRKGSSLRLFPYTTAHNSTTWYAPTEAIDSTLVPSADRQYFADIFTLLNQEVQAGSFDKVDEYLDLMARYQQKNGGKSLPSDTVVKAEHWYNAVPLPTILFMFNLTLGLVLIGLFIYQLISQRPYNNLMGWTAYGLMTLSFLALTWCEALRWIISGTIPLGNGYETMLVMAWFIQLITLLLYRRFRILLAFGFLLSGFFLLVSHISQMDPQIGRLMPVLRSPLLTIHVGIIMMAFALLSITFICGLTALIYYLINQFGKKADKGSQESNSDSQSLEAYSNSQSQEYDNDSQTVLLSLSALSQVFLYPALTTLGMGIFIGAIWANVSWGNYWSWDPKEVWALITFMVYAVAVHQRSFPLLRKPLAYHLYVTLAYLTILMTYFGVNYLLGGMHSYA